MMEQAAAERFLGTLRQARAAADLDAMAALFDEEADFAIVGFGPPAMGRTAVLATIGRLIDDFEFVEWDPICTLVCGDEIAVRHRLKVRHRKTGKMVDTETSEFLSMRNGKCRSFTQFADTALIAQLITA